jgi:hypothetical protein
MTRERLVDLVVAAIMKHAGSLAGKPCIGGFLIADAAGDVADSILAEMAGEWNAACDAIVLACCKASDSAIAGGAPNSAQAFAAAAAIARLRRRPDAAPERPSTWQHGDPRCDNCDNGQEKEWVFCPFCGHQTKFEDDYGSEVPPRPATPSVEEVAWAIHLVDHHNQQKAADYAWDVDRELRMDQAAAVLALFAKERS